MKSKCSAFFIAGCERGREREGEEEGEGKRDGITEMRMNDKRRKGRRGRSEHL